jgi:positive regulator of sigma E activity
VWSLRAQTLAVGRRARRQLLWAGPLLALIVVLYLLRGELVGSDQPFRLVAAAAFAITGWVFARSLGHALEPQLAHRWIPAPRA